MFPRLPSCRRSHSRCANPNTCLLSARSPVRGCCHGDIMKRGSVINHHNTLLSLLLPAELHPLGNLGTMTVDGECQSDGPVTGGPVHGAGDEHRQSAIRVCNRQSATDGLQQTVRNRQSATDGPQHKVGYATQSLQCCCLSKTANSSTRRFLSIKKTVRFFKPQSPKRVKPPPTRSASPTQ